MKLEIKREVEIRLEIAETYTKKVFDLEVKLAEKFNFSAVPEVLSRVGWVNVLPIYIPQGVDNRQALTSLTKAGFQNASYEEVDVMKYTGSEASDKPRLLLIEHSARPNKSTMGQSANELVKTGKLWLPLKGYAIGMGSLGEGSLDTETWTWFPGETLPDGGTANGLWYPSYRRARFYWNNPDNRNDNIGGREEVSALKESARTPFS